MYTEVIFDIETERLFDQIDDRSKLDDLGVSVVSAYKRVLDERFNEVKGEMVTFWNSSVSGYGPALEEFFEFVLGADRIIGFNSIRFDVPILNSHLPGDFIKMNHFDVLEKVREALGHRLALDVLAKENVGEAKKADGLMAVDWWQRKDELSLRLLKEYCEQDVMVTTKVYDVGLLKGVLQYRDRWNEPREFKVDFSYPPKVESPQLGLFF